MIFDVRGCLAVQSKNSKEKPISVDFVGGKSRHRRKFGNGKKQNFAKAIGLNQGVRPSVLDATVGLGQDAFVLACLGCQVTMVERSPVIAALLTDGLRRALEDNDLTSIIARMKLIKDDSIKLMKTSENKYDVIYLDPMFPHQEKRSLVKKEMRILRDLLGDDSDANQLLQPALDLAEYRVVVKRPRLAQDLNGQTPTYRLKGKSCRYDIYTLKTFNVKPGKHSDST